MHQVWQRQVKEYLLEDFWREYHCELKKRRLLSRTVEGYTFLMTWAIFMVADEGGPEISSVIATRSHRKPRWAKSAIFRTTRNQRPWITGFKERNDATERRHAERRDGSSLVWVKNDVRRPTRCKSSWSQRSADNLESPKRVRSGLRLSIDRGRWWRKNRSPWRIGCDEIVWRNTDGEVVKLLWLLYHLLQLSLHFLDRLRHRRNQMNSLSSTSTQVSLRSSIIFGNTISSSSLPCQFRVEPFLAITVEE